MIRLIIATDPFGVIGVKYKYTEDGSPPVGAPTTCACGHIGTEHDLKKDGGPCLECDCPKLDPQKLEPRRNWYYRWKMPWHYKQDLRRFKKLTMGSTLIMGSTTWNSLPGALPGRSHIILTHNPYGVWTDTDGDHAPDNCISANSLEEALSYCGEGDVWIAGGSQVYQQALDCGCVEEIDHTIVPEVDLNAIENLDEVIRFNLGPILEDYKLVGEERNPLDERLLHRRYQCPLPVFKS